MIAPGKCLTIDRNPLCSPRERWRSYTISRFTMRSSTREMEYPKILIPPDGGHPPRSAHGNRPSFMVFCGLEESGPMAGKNPKPFRYETEDKKHVYGKSDRWPGEKLLVNQINELHITHPDFEMMLLGTSGVSGEEFPLFLTI